MLGIPFLSNNSIKACFYKRADPIPPYLKITVLITPLNPIELDPGIFPKVKYKDLLISSISLCLTIPPKSLSYQTSSVPGSKY